MSPLLAPIEYTGKPGTDIPATMTRGAQIPRGTGWPANGEHAKKV
jgi:hypothetical protein